MATIKDEGQGLVVEGYENTPLNSDCLDQLNISEEEKLEIIGFFRSERQVNALNKVINSIFPNCNQIIRN